MVKHMKTFKQLLLNNQEAQSDDILPVNTWHEMLHSFLKATVVKYIKIFKQLLLNKQEAQSEYLGYSAMKFPQMDDIGLWHPCAQETQCCIKSSTMGKKI